MTTYMTFAKVFQERGLYPEIASFPWPLHVCGLIDRQNAESIFKFVGESTLYYKLRDLPMHLGYQYTKEERLMIMLKAVPIPRSPYK